MLHSRFLVALALSVFFWVGLYLAVTLTIDPYGVSPVPFSLERINKHKPRRLNIDRLLKPYEVWKREPRTLFLGTSRTHQSIDPAVLDRTRFAPAYNASIPASSLSMNVAHLRQYVNLDPQLRTVVVELFLYNFLEPWPEEKRASETLADYLRGTASLFFSVDALWDSVLTVGFNILRNKPHYEIKPGGYFNYPPGHDPSGPFAGYAAGIWKYHEPRADGLRMNRSAFDACREMLDIARERKLELVFVLTPNHAYDDYYIEAVNGWDTVAQWLARISVEATVYSFSQPNAWVYEPVGKDMRYWNDPYHFSLEMGAEMQRALAGTGSAGAPDNFAVRMTPDRIAAHIAERRHAIVRWAQANPDFVTKFNEERSKWEIGRDKGGQKKPVS